MDLLCRLWDCEFFTKNKHIATLRKKNDESLYTKYTINNVNLDKFDKILGDYITTHSYKFDYYILIANLK